MLTVDYGTSSADVYPARGKNRPVLIVVHGGAWFVGHRHYMSHVCTTLGNAIDAVCIAPSYALSSIDRNIMYGAIGADLVILIAILFGTSKRGVIILIIVLVVLGVIGLNQTFTVHDRHMYHHPRHVMDIATCVRWVHEHIHEHGGDKNNIVLVGHSAGAHLCALLALNDRYMHQVGLPRSIIKGVVAISGPYSHRRLHCSPLLAALVHRSVFRTHKHTNPSELADAWPLTSIDPSVYNPPFLIMVAELDGSLHDHAHDMVTALTQAGIYARYQLVPSTTHFTIRRNLDGKNRQTLECILDFLKQVFNEKVPAIAF
jgi:acetyl esterase/lipase